MKEQKACKTPYAEIDKKKKEKEKRRGVCVLE
jgi:hypothetical protein